MAYLLHSKQTKLHGKAVKGFPLILWEDDRVHWVALHFLLDKYNGENTSSISTYAQHLQDLLSQLECEPEYADVPDIDEAFLKAFKQSILERKNGGTKKNYASQILATVITYCKWLEDNGFSRNLIGETKLHRIRIKISDKGKVKHPLTKLHKSNSSPSRAPRTSWIEIIKEYGPKTRRVSKRFNLMIDWARTLGLRAHEVVALKIRDIPSIQSAEKAIIEGELLDIRLIVTKGNNDATVRVQPLLVKQTWEYIDTLREESVANATKLNKMARKKARAKGKPIPAIYEDEGDLFVSDQSGLNIHKNTFSNQVRAAFLAACDAGTLTEEERVWAHGMRHNFVVKVLKKYDEEGVKRPEVLARQASRHGSDIAMEPYATERYNPRFE